jgi:hypothetical protein
MTLVGELVLARNQLLQVSNTVEDTNLHAVSQRMNLIATELQEEVMKTRMQPIGNVWSQFPRTVRDVALGCGKEVEIEMEGKETELDKTIIEAIKDPLTHLVRNSVDHGIELPEERVKAGKERAGRLILRAALGVDLEGDADGHILKEHCDLNRWRVCHGVQVIVAASDDCGGESIQPSAKPAILFLKLPATMLQTSPSASATSGPTLSSATPSIFEVMSAADFSLQRTLSTPHSCPANPTMAVTSISIFSTVPMVIS